MLASFGQGTNAIKSAEQGTGLGLPIAKNLVDLHGGTFTLKSKLRVGTEVIVTFPPERVMSALGPGREPSPPIQPAARCQDASASSQRRSAHAPHCLPRAILILPAGNRPEDGNADRIALHQGLHHRSAIRPVPGCGRSLAEIEEWSSLSDGERHGSWLNCRSGSRAGTLPVRGREETTWATA